MSLQGKRILVVGASAGIGQGFAARALADGAEVLSVARRAEPLAALGGHALVADLSSPDVGTVVAEAVREHLGGLDVVLLAAGASPLKRISDVTDADWQTVLQTNLVGNHRVVTEVLPLLAERGLVAALSSESVGEGRSGLAAYSASKAGLEQLMRSWRMEHPAVRFSTVVIGATFPTEFGSAFDLELLGQLFPEWISRGQLVPEMMPTDDVATALVGLLGTFAGLPAVGVEHVVLRSPAIPALPA